MRKPLHTVVAVLISVVISSCVTIVIVKILDHRKKRYEDLERQQLPSFQYEYHVQRYQDEEHRTPENLKEIRAYSLSVRRREEKKYEKWVDAYLYEGPWSGVEAEHVILKYQDLDSLKKFNRNINLPGEWGLERLFSRGEDPVDLARKELGVVFKRVMKLVDLPYKEKYKVKILLFKNLNQLHAEYHKIYRHPHPPVRAWYIYEYNTIYVNVRDIHEGILAHEMTHAVVDNYINMRLPREVSEIVAKYVEQGFHG